MNIPENIKVMALQQIAEALKIPVDAVDADRLSIEFDHWDEYVCEDGCCTRPEGDVVMLNSYTTRTVSDGEMFGMNSPAGMSVGVVLAENSENFELFKKYSTTVDKDKN